jgi:hypothetical protein
MAYTIEQFQKDVAKEHLHFLKINERSQPLKIMGFTAFYLPTVLKKTSYKQHIITGRLTRDTELSNH